MSTLVRKEIRMILPAWVLAMVLAILPVWLLWPGAGYAYYLQSPGGFVYGAFAIGVLLLGLTSFGQELNHGTFSMLLAQPVARRQVWRIKTWVLATGLALAFMALFLSIHFRVESFIDSLSAGRWRHLLSGTTTRTQMLAMIAQTQRDALTDSLILGGLSALAAFAGGLWTNLLFRNPSFAFWISLIVPVGLGLLANLFGGLAGELALIPVLGGYSLAGFLWARKFFLRVEDVQWMDSVVALPRFGGSAAAEKLAVAKRKPWRALLWKELQFQQVNLLLAAALWLMHVADLVVRKLGFQYFESHRSAGMIWESFPILWLTIPLLFGAVAIAEERKLGTLESQLCLPAGRRFQFAVKLILVVLLGAATGVLACATEYFGVNFLNLNDSAFLLSQTPSADMAAWCLIWCAVFPGLAFVAFCASSHARNLLQAIGTGIVAAATLMGFAAWANTGRIQPWSNQSTMLWQGPLVWYIGLPVVIAVLLWLAFRNFKRVQIGWNVWLGNLGASLAGLAFIVVATVLTWNRVWELVLPLEPPHGPARLSGPIEPRICFAGPRAFVLVPDGRLWAASVFRPIERKVAIPVPVSGEFVGTNKWINLAGTWNEVVGIQADGSLWRIFKMQNLRSYSMEDFTSTPVNLERIGTNSDWKKISAGYRFFLALKQDGSLWGWGDNKYGQLGSGPEKIPNSVVRVGHESDWVNIFTENVTSFGVKRDGSVWKWGYLRTESDSETSAHPEPVLCGSNGADWKEVVGNSAYDIVLHQDGKLWASGLLPQNIMGQNFDQKFSPKLIRVGTTYRWNDISGSFGQLVAISQRGALFQNFLYENQLLGFGNVRQPSKYSDWAAVADNNFWSGRVVGLAADGTVSCWSYSPYGEAAHSTLLGPSRKPAWSLNIFAATQSPTGTSP